MKSISNSDINAVKRFISVALSMLLLSGILSAATEKNPASVTVSYDGLEGRYETYASTVGDFFANENIVLKDSDYVSHTDNASVSDGMRVVIKVAKYITVNDGGETYGAVTYAADVKGVMDDFAHPLRSADITYPPKDDRVYDGTVITVKRALQVSFTRDGSTIKRYTQSATVGDFLEEIGAKPSSFQKVVPSADTVLTDGMTIRFADIEDPMTDLNFNADLSDATIINCMATAYTSAADETWPYSDGRTATGALCRVGVVAVDPNVIPLKSKLFIESADGSFVYGYCVAEDTGGGIKGNRVDLVMNTKEECYSFGVRAVKVYILS